MKKVLNLKPNELIEAITDTTQKLNSCRTELETNYLVTLNDDALIESFGEECESFLYLSKNEQKKFLPVLREIVANQFKENKNTSRNIRDISEKLYSFWDFK